MYFVHEYTIVDQASAYRERERNLCPAGYNLPSK